MRTAAARTKTVAGEAQSQSEPAVDVHEAPLFPSTATSVRRVAGGGSRLLVALGGQ